jgi:hypothetical protein
MRSPESGNEAKCAALSGPILVDILSQQFFSYLIKAFCLDPDQILLLELDIRYVFHQQKCRLSQKLMTSELAVHTHTQT